MENNASEKEVKGVSKPSKYATIRVRKETRRRVLQDVMRCNKKDYGRKVRADDLVSLSLNKVTAEDIKNLQDASLSHQDRLERHYREYAAKYGALSKDEFVGKLLSGEFHALAAKNRTGNKSAESTFSVDKNNGLEPNSVAQTGGK